MDESPDQDSVLLDKSVDGLFYVLDEDGGRYEMEEFLGEVRPVFQVFRAIYTNRNNIGDRQIVALKLGRIHPLQELENLKLPVNNSFIIGPNAGQENRVITADNIILGIYKHFRFGCFLCISMPYMNRGSLRYIIKSRFADHKLPNEKCIAVALREALKGLCFLHGRGKVNRNINAGNIFVADTGNQLAIKLGYRGTNYLHDPELDSGRRVWEKIWATDPQKSLFWKVSRLPEYEAESEIRHRDLYEPNRNNSSSASDIWNFGITAIELALGGLRSYSGNMRNPDEMRVFLINFLENEELQLPSLHDLFIPDQEMQSFDPQGRKTEEINIIKDDFLAVGSRLKPDPHFQRNNGLSSSFVAMVRRCLIPDPDSRPSAQMLLNDPFFVEHQDAGLQYFADSVLST